MHSMMDESIPVGGAKWQENELEVLGKQNIPRIWIHHS